MPEEGALYFASTAVSIDKGNATVAISGNFEKPLTTDDVTLTVIGSSDKKDVNGNDLHSYVEKPVYSKTIPWNETHTGDLSFSLQNNEDLTHFRFIVSSESNVRWDEINWKPVVSYNDSTGVLQSNSVCADYRIYADHITDAQSFAYTSTDSVMTVKPIVAFANTTYNGKLTLTVKTVDRLLGKKTFNVVSGILTNDSISILKSDIDSEKIWFEFFSEDCLISDAVTATHVQVSSPSTVIPQTVEANLYAVKDATGLGHLYRGWGGFVYNSSENRYSAPIDETLLKLPEDENAQIDPLTRVFTPMSPDLNKLDRLQGQREEIYITESKMGSARLTELDVVLVNPLENIGDISGLTGEHIQGTGAAAIVQKTVTKNNVIQAGLIITFNDANGTNETKSMMIDLNGGGYPDIVAGGKIQYTNSQGGISGETFDGIGSNKGKSESKAYALGSDPIVGVFATVSKVRGHEASAGTNNKAKGSMSGSLSLAPSNEDWSTEQFVDVNGDGLPDKIISGNQVRINLGYTFTEPIDWDIDRIQGGKGTSFTASIGGGVGKGFNWGSGSFAGGVNIVTSTNGEEYNIIDLNSDGLPDKVWKSGDNIMVALNTGVGFDTPFIWKGATALNESASTAEGGNIAFTVNITPKVVPIKISVNPSVSMSHSINRTKYSLQDVDGDGYLDIVESDSESELKVTRSAIGRTNMLKSVTNSIGGRFEVDYAHSTPTYGHPGGKWVMSALTIDDGIHDDGPLMKSAFEYSDGFRDRHERDFLGFGKVVTKSLDTNSGNSVYRQAVQEFAVDNYYASGNLVASYVTDASGNKFTETVNEYDAYSVTANADSYSFVQKDVIYSDCASAFVPLRYTANRQYEGASQGMVISEAWNEYYLNGYHGELKSYRYSDKGSLGSNGAGGYDYATNIQYTSNDGKHIFGLPTNVTVVGVAGSMYHNVSATYDTKYPNHLTQVSQQLGSGVAVTDYKYDRYGNIIQKTLPANGTVSVCGTSTATNLR